MSTPKTYLNSIRLRIVVTLAAFIAMSVLIYKAMQSCRTAIELVLVAAAFFCLFIGVCMALVHDFKEIRRVRKLLVLAISVLLSATMCQNTEAVIIYPGLYPLLSVKASHPPAVQKHQEQPPQDGKPDVTVCELLAALIVIGVGVIIVYNLRKCALKALYPCGNPPTNCPPGSTTNGDDDNVMVRFMGAYVQPMNVVTADSSQIGFDPTFAASNWTDWTGSPITGCFGGSVSNFTDPNNLAIYFNSSTNLLSWTREVLCVTGWVSETPLTTNVTEVVYDEYGQAFETNWITATQTIRFGSMLVRSNQPAMYFKISP